jgi:tight adherence protein C
MASVIALGFASLFLLFWLIQLFSADESDWIAAATDRVVWNIDETEKLKLKAEQKREKLENYNGAIKSFMRLFLSVDYSKEINTFDESSAQLRHGNMKTVNLFTVPGYVFLRKHSEIMTSQAHKKIITTFIELHGKKYASERTRLLFAKILSYPVIGIGFSLALGALMLSSGMDRQAYMVMGVGSLLIAVLSYAVYDEVSSTAAKRREAIARQFPNVVSKLALLTTSGMIVDKAWRDTAYSKSGELYVEMRKTSMELDNLVPPEAAYGDFIKRCNTKETTKLAAAILQNISKGNAEIGKLLKSMAKEAWEERKHGARKDAEKANSKLMIPTMILLVAILIMIMVPVGSNLTNMGF